MFHVPAHKNLAAPAGQIVNSIVSEPPKAPVDFVLQYGGSISFLEAVSEAAQEWVAEHLPSDVTRWGKDIVIEHRYVEPIVRGIEAAGLYVW